RLLEARRRLAAAARNGPPEARRESLRKRVGALPEAVLGGGPAEQVAEAALQVRQVDPVLRPPRTGDARGDRGELEREQAAVVAVAAPRDSEESLRLEVAPDRLDLLGAASGRQKILAGLLVDG